MNGERTLNTHYKIKKRDIFIFEPNLCHRIKIKSLARDSPNIQVNNI